MANIGALDQLHARVAAPLPVELPVTDVDGDDSRRTALQQAIGEAAGRGADVERRASADVDLPVLQRRFQLEAAAADEGEIVADDVNLGFVVDHRARLVDDSI